jgi:hypothetical protein
MAVGAKTRNQELAITQLPGTVQKQDFPHKSLTLSVRAT